MAFMTCPGAVLMAAPAASTAHGNGCNPPQLPLPQVVRRLAFSRSCSFSQMARRLGSRPPRRQGANASSARVFKLPKLRSSLVHNQVKVVTQLQEE